jgi:hypothetical protein
VQTILKFLNEIDTRSLPHLPKECQKYAKVNITSVRKDHMRMGIASKLVEMTIEMAKKNGCQGVYTQVH